MTNQPDEQARRWDQSVRDELPGITIDVAGTVADKRDQIVASINEYGFALLDGLGANDEPETAMVELGDVLGTTIAQSPVNDRVEHVTDNTPQAENDSRGYRSGGPLTPHTDPPTLLALHCLRPAVEGGESWLMSAATLYHAVAERSPELVGELSQPFIRWQTTGQFGRRTAGAGDSGVPVFATADGSTSCVYYRPFIEKGATAMGKPLTKAQVAALDAMDEVANDSGLALRFTLQRGQTIVIHNRFVLHARTDYRDSPEPGQRRDLLRVWIDAPEWPGIPDVHRFGDLFASQNA